MFSPYAAMGNSPGMMIDPNGELTKDAQPVQDNGMDYAGLDAIAVRAFMDGVMSGLYNINFMFGSNTMVMASGSGSAGVQNVGQVWLPKYSDNMSLCNIFRAALSDVPSDIIGIKGFTVAPDNSIYVTYSYVTHSSRPSEEGEDGGTYNLIDQYALSERTTKFSLPPRGDLQKQQGTDGDMVFIGHPHVDDFDGFWGQMKYLWTGGIIGNAWYDRHGDLQGLAPITGTPPNFIGGPLRKGQSAIKIGKYLFNPNYLHTVVKPQVLRRAGDFAKTVGHNPDIGVNGIQIILTGARNGPYAGKTFETGLSILDFIF